MLRKLQKIGIIAGLVMVMGGMLTCLMTWRNLGFTQGFVGAWLSSFALCILCIAPIGGVIAFLVNKFVQTMFPALSSVMTNVVFGLIMATIMESIMASVTTVNLHGFVELQAFLVYWLSTLSAALPAGLVLSVILSIVIKPRLAAFWAKD